MTTTARRTRAARRWQRAGLALVLAFVKYPDVTSDKLLTAVFGGFFIGAGIGLAIRGGAVLDGTEIAALLISKGSNVLVPV